MLQRGVYSDFLFDRFAFFFCRLGSQLDQFARGDAVAFDVDCTVYAAIG